MLEDRARVIRRGTASLPAGQSRLIVRGVAPVLVDKTLTATTSAGRVLDVRCVRRLAPFRDTAAGRGVAARAEPERPAAGATPAPAERST